MWGLWTLWNRPSGVYVSLPTVNKCKSLWRIHDTCLIKKNSLSYEYLCNDNFFSAQFLEFLASFITETLCGNASVNSDSWESKTWTAQVNLCKNSPFCYRGFGHGSLNTQNGRRSQWCFSATKLQKTALGPMGFDGNLHRQHHYLSLFHLNDIALASKLHIHRHFENYDSPNGTVWWLISDPLLSVLF